MMPWIRSWGSGVVVEEPPELRQRIVRSVMRQARQHGLTFDSAERDSLLSLLWTKYDPKTGAWHQLIYHLLDVAAVAACMWDDALSAGQKAWLQKTLGVEAEAAQQLLALLAGLHDIGKATPSFHEESARSLRRATWSRLARTLSGYAARHAVSGHLVALAYEQGTKQDASDPAGSSYRRASWRLDHKH